MQVTRLLQRYVLLKELRALLRQAFGANFQVKVTHQAHS